MYKPYDTKNEEKVTDRHWRLVRSRRQPKANYIDEIDGPGEGFPLGRSVIAAVCNATVKAARTSTIEPRASNLGPKAQVSRAAEK